MAHRTTEQLPQTVVLCLYICRRQQLKEASSRLPTDSVSSTSSSRDSADDVINRCSAATDDCSKPQLHNSRTDDVTDTVPTTLHSGTVPPTILADGTVPEALDYRSMLVGAALARQQMMTSLGRHGYRNYQCSSPYRRRFTPYVITNDFTPTRFRPA